MITNKLFFNAQDLDAINKYSLRINDEMDGDEIGYYHLPKFGEEIIKKVEDFFTSRIYTDVVIVGIGGSSLGAKALLSMLEASRKKPHVKFHFLDNVDNYSFNKIVTNINFAQTIFIVTSKSGSTIETITMFKAILDYFKPHTLSENFVFITNPKSNLEIYAKENNISVFNIPQNVGGRFSVLSAAGLIPLIAGGCDADRLLEGAAQCKKQFLDKEDDTILQKAYHYAMHKNAKINVLFCYNDRLYDFNEWYVQLWAESLGKKRGYRRMGLTPVGLVGSRDQHSFLQLIMDGPKDKTVTFIKVLDCGFDTKIPNISIKYLENCDFVNNLTMNELINAQCDATMHALLNEKISIDLITIDKLDEWHVGYLIYYFELLTSATGVMLGINTYDQPGVETGKIILKTILSR